MFQPHKYMVRRKKKWKLEGGGKRRREEIHLFFLTQFFDLQIGVVTPALGFGLKVYGKDM